MWENALIKFKLLSTLPLTINQNWGKVTILANKISKIIISLNFYNNTNNTHISTYKYNVQQQYLVQSLPVQLDNSTQWHAWSFLKWNFSSSSAMTHITLCILHWCQYLAALCTIVREVQLEDEHFANNEQQPNYQHG